MFADITIQDPPVKRSTCLRYLLKELHKHHLPGNCPPAIKPVIRIGITHLLLFAAFCGRFFLLPSRSLPAVIAITGPSC